MQEIWKDVVGYEGLYKVSNLGNVISLNYRKTNKPKKLSYNVNHKGYLDVHLTKNRTSKHKIIHRLVALAFIPNPNNLPQINHIDGNKQNNNVNNLEWCDNSQNQKHAYKLGLKKKLFGIDSPKHTKIYQYDLNGNFIKTWNYIKEASETLNICQSNISLCCIGSYKSAGGYIWRYANK